MSPERAVKDLLHLCRLWHRMADLYDSDYDPVGASVATTYRMASRDTFFLLCKQHGEDAVYQWDMEIEEEPQPEYVAKLGADFGLSD